MKPEEWPEPSSCRALSATVRIQAFVLSDMGSHWGVLSREWTWSHMASEERFSCWGGVENTLGRGQGEGAGRMTEVRKDVAWTKRRW